MGKSQVSDRDKNFVGLTGYYRRFIEGFSKIVVPLTQFTRKD